MHRSRVTRLSYSNRDHRFKPNIRFTVGAKPVQEEQVRVHMIPWISTLHRQLAAIMQQVEAEASIHSRALLSSDQMENINQWMLHFHQQLWEVTIATFGLYMAEPGRNNSQARHHTGDYNKRVAGLSAVMHHVSEAEGLITEVDGIQLEHVRAIGSGTEEAVPFEEATELRHSLLKIAEVMLEPPPQDLLAALNLIDTARKWSVATYKELKDSAAQDKKRKAQAMPTALWKAGMIKKYLQNLRSAATHKTISFVGVHLDYLQYLVNKVLPEGFPMPTGQPLHRPDVSTWDYTVLTDPYTPSS